MERMTKIKGFWVMFGFDGFERANIETVNGICRRSHRAPRMDIDALMGSLARRFAFYFSFILLYHYKHSKRQDVSFAPLFESW